LEKPKASEKAYRSVTEYVTFYNEERFQQKLGDRSPVEYRKAVAA
jgi:putative transposase